MREENRDDPRETEKSPVRLPDAGGSASAATGHQAFDDIIEYLKSVSLPLVMAARPVCHAPI